MVNSFVRGHQSPYSPGRVLYPMVRLLQLCGICPRCFQTGEVQEHRWRNLSLQNCLVLVLGLIFILIFPFILEFGARWVQIFWYWLGFLFICSRMLTLLHFLFRQNELLTILNILESELAVASGQNLEKHSKIVRRHFWLFVSVVAGNLIIRCLVTIVFPGRRLDSYPLRFQIESKIGYILAMLSYNVFFTYVFFLLSAVLEMLFGLVCVMFIQTLEQNFMNAMMRRNMITENITPRNTTAAAARSMTDGISVTAKKKIAENITARCMTNSGTASIAAAGNMTSDTITERSMIAENITTARYKSFRGIKTRNTTAERNTTFGSITANDMTSGSITTIKLSAANNLCTTGSFTATKVTTGRITASDLLQLLIQHKRLYVLLKKFNCIFSKVLFVWYTEISLGIVFGVPGIILEFAVTSRVNFRALTIVTHHVINFLVLTICGSGIQKRFQELQTDLQRRLETAGNVFVADFTAEDGDVFQEKLSHMNMLSKLRMDISVWGFFVIQRKLLFTLILNTITISVIVVQI